MDLNGIHASCGWVHGTGRDTRRTDICALWAWACGERWPDFVKPVMYNDVLAAVAYVSSYPIDAREAALAGLIDQVQQAEAHTQRFCAAHPMFGDGTLLTAALRHGKRGDTSLQSERGLEAWVLVLDALLSRVRQLDAQPIQREKAGANSDLLSKASPPQSSQ